MVSSKWAVSTTNSENEIFVSVICGNTVSNFTLHAWISDYFRWIFFRQANSVADLVCQICMENFLLGKKSHFSIVAGLGMYTNIVLC